MIRFEKIPKILKIEITNRKIAAAKRYNKKQHEKYPLLSIMGELDNLPTPEERLKNFEEQGEQAEQRWRDFDAELWWKARRKLKELPCELSKKVLFVWNHHDWCPGKAIYFLEAIRSIEKDPHHYDKLIELFNKFIHIPGKRGVEMMAKCNICKDSGKRYVKCLYCDGSGKVDCFNITVDCGHCEGTGEMIFKCYCQKTKQNNLCDDKRAEARKIFFSMRGM